MNVLALPGIVRWRLPVARVGRQLALGRGAFEAARLTLSRKPAKSAVGER